MGLYKRGQVWWMSFTYDGRCIRRSTEVSNKKLALKIYCKVMAQITEGKWFEKPAEKAEEEKGWRLRDLMERYISEYAVPNLAPKTVEWKENMTKPLLKFFGNVKLADITPRRIASYKSACRKKGLSPATINHRIGILRHAFNFAKREWEWVKENPVTRISREKVNNARDRWLTLEEEDTLLAASILYATGKGNTRESHYWLQELVVFALNTGMRQDEILSLKWTAVDLFRKTATVVKSKNGDKRTIPLNKAAFQLLKAKARNIRSDYVFPSEAGTKIDARNLLRAFYSALKRAEIEDFRFHDLRHTFATRLAHAGVDLYKIAKLLGHRDIRVTQRYSHHYSESLRDGVEVLDKNFHNFFTVKQQGASPN